MSRIAIVADIHANPHALDAVLADIDQLGVDEVLINGDLVGRGPLGSAVIARVRDRGLASSRGNHEDYQLQFRRGEVPDDWLTLEEWSCARWMAAELSDDDIAFIDALPFTITSEAEPEVRLFHGSPRSHREGLGRWTPEDRLRQHIESIDEAVLVVAHTHRPFEWRFDDQLIVNVGSVGMPFNGDTRAQYAVLEGTGRNFAVEMRQVEYDRTPLLRAYDDTGFVAAGGATAHFLRIELTTARPHLVPFLKWCEHESQPATMAHVAAFDELYDPALPMSEFARMIGL